MTHMATPKAALRAAGVDAMVRAFKDRWSSLARKLEICRPDDDGKNRRDKKLYSAVEIGMQLIWCFYDK
jgi:hypothetical protein